MSMFIGESLVGEGNEIAHIDLLIGSKDGPVGTAFANALADQKQGFSNLLAVITPNLVCKPATVLITKVTIKGGDQAVPDVRPGPVRRGPAVTDCVAEGVIPKSEVERPGHRLRRLHPLGSQGQGQDLRVQLPGHQAGHPAGHEERAEDRRDPPRKRTRKHPFSPK